MENDVRERCRIALGRELGDNDAAAALEEALFRKHNGNVGNEYRADTRARLLNLHDNPDLAKRLRSGVVDAQRVATMTDEEMASEQRRAENEKLEKEALRETIGEDTLRHHATTDFQEQATGRVLNTGFDMEFDPPNS